jgi:predicted O-linked N-acetylglucosamine transferase (SPINDLY family)
MLSRGRPTLASNMQEVKDKLVDPRGLANLNPLVRAHRAALQVSRQTSVDTLAATAAKAEARIAAEPSEPQPYLTLSRCRAALGQNEHALDVLHAGVADARPDNELWRLLAWRLLETGLADEALDHLTRAVETFPNDPELLLLARLAVPAIVTDASAAPRWLARVRSGLASITLDDRFEQLGISRQELLRAATRANLFWCDYLCADTRELHATWGQWLCSLHPEEPLPVPHEASDGRVRVGFVGETLYRHVVGELFVAWVTGLDPKRFDIRCYSLAEDRDDTTREFQRASSRFVQSAVAHELVHAIREDAPQVLIYLGVGMSSELFKLASRRLAKVQCAAWGHPVTTGLPTIDYFLSSDAIEPAGADGHYTERLVRLPGLGTNFQLPPMLRPLHAHSREDFGLATGEIAFACTQTSPKFLPSFDRVLIALAQRVPESRFVFVRQPQSAVLERRLSEAFADAGLDWGRHGLVLPWLDRIEFNNLLVVSDALLDPIGWSGGYTAIIAIAAVLPIVCMSGPVFRTRQSAGMLRMLGETRTIAHSEEEYVAIAERLARDVPFRDSVRARLLDPAGLERLCNDPRVIPSLADFLERVAR